MKFGLCADLHLHRWSAFATVTPDGLNSRLAGLLSEIERCAREVADCSDAPCGERFIVLAGDVFHVRGSVAPSVLNPTRDMLRHIWGQYGVRTIIIAGNHDLEGRESERLGSAVTALECDYVTVHNSESTFENLVFMPWVESADKLKEELKLTANSFGGGPENMILIMHAPIDGVIEGLPLHGISPDFLAGLGFMRVFSGHYHNHKAMAGDKVVSIGALAHHSWSDVKSKAGFLIVDSKDGSFEWRCSNLPRFLDLDNLAELDPMEVELTVDGNYVRIKIDSDQVKAVEQARKELIDMGAAGVIVQSQPKQVQRAGTVAASVASAVTLEASLMSWIDGSIDPGLASAVSKAAIDVLNSPAVVA